MMRGFYLNREGIERRGTGTCNVSLPPQRCRRLRLEVQRSELLAELPGLGYSRCGIGLNDATVGRTDPSDVRN